jgi:hypothetical protein
MPKYVIEREVPGAGKLSAGELRDLSVKSNKVIFELGPEIKWLQSFVTADKLYCVCVAPDEDIIYEHARCGGFPGRQGHAGLDGHRPVDRGLTEPSAAAFMVR